MIKLNGVNVQKNSDTYLVEKIPTNEKKKTGNKDNTKSVFAGDTNLPTDKILEKQQQAHDHAMKLIMDAFAVDKKIDTDLEERLKRIRANETDIQANKAELKRINEEREELNEIYGLDDEINQENLALLERYKKIGADEFTKEELDRLDYIKRDGRLLEYQERNNELDRWEKHYTEENNRLKNEIKTENAIISETNRARLALRHMLDATNGAEDILKASSDEIKGIIVDDSVEHIKEESDKQEKQAEELAEKQKKQQEFIEKLKERRENDTSPINDITRNIISLEKQGVDVKTEVKKIISKLNLIEDDIKGVAVDRAT